MSPHHPSTSYAKLAYDTVWTVALTLRETMATWEEEGLGNLSLSQFSYNNEEMKETFVRVLEKLEFVGVTVR